jgi:hypothetical protein
MGITSLLPDPTRTYKLFISYDWEYEEHYRGVVALLNSDPLFKWDDYSIPKTNPVLMSLHLPRSNRTIVRAIDERMKQADCAIFLAGVYATNSGWIQSEIEAAQEFGIPIIGVRPRGQERISSIVQNAAGANMVYWNSASLIGRIVQLCSPPDYYSNLAQIALRTPPGVQSGIVPVGSTVASVAQREISKPPEIGSGGILGPRRASTTNLSSFVNGLLPPPKK